MDTIKNFLTYNFRQVKTAFTAVTVIFALFITALLLFGSKKYSLFDTITLPIGLGVFAGLIVVLIMVFAGYTNWLYRERYFKKHLKILIETYQFDIRPYPKSIWAITLPALFGSLNNQDMIIELIEQKDLFISFINQKTPANNKHGFIYSYKNFKKLGIDNLVNELTHMTTPV
jgi:membrane-bound metal-dependent hydrolase YbcI (DUF457 family)